MITAERADRDCYRIKLDATIVAFALRMANGTWMLFAPDMETRLYPDRFKTPRTAASYWRRVHGA